MRRVRFRFTALPERNPAMRSAALWRERCLRKSRAACASQGSAGKPWPRPASSVLFPPMIFRSLVFPAVRRRLPPILRRIRETADAVVAARPDALIIIDSPDFTHRVARQVRQREPSIPILDYVSPTVWAWRPWRGA